MIHVLIKITSMKLNRDLYFATDYKKYSKIVQIYKFAIDHL